MQKWQAFLNSLATRGGAIFMLAVVFVTGVAVSMHLIHNGESGSPLAASLIGTFSSFGGAFLIALKGSSDSSATVSGPSGTATASTSPTPSAPTEAAAVAEAK